MVDRLMLRAEVLETTALSYATIWNKMRRNEFPRSVVIGKGSAAKVAWKASEIQEWLDNLPRQSFLGDPGYEATLADLARREAGRKGGTTRARNMKLKRTRRRLPK